jgi:hypothetical protein
VYHSAGSILVPGFGPASPSPSTNVSKTLRAKSAFCSASDDYRLSIGFQELLKLMLEREDSLLNVGREAELSRCQIFN